MESAAQAVDDARSRGGGHSRHRSAGASPAFHDTSGIFEPRAIAVIGASDRPGNLGGDTVRRLLKFGFPGPVWPVNRSGEPVAGVPAFKSVHDLPGTADLAVLSIPADGLLDAIRDCIAVGMRAGVAYAGGLAEAGGAGVDRQESISRLCRDNGFMLCGPNCVGAINAAHPVTATFATALHELDALRVGAISMVSQSGGIATNALTLAEEAGFGLRHMVSSGNEAVVDFSDYLHAFCADDGTRVIVGYLEGISDGPKFIKVLEEARDLGKPVLLVKAGTTGASARAAQAHTGSLVGEDRVFDALMEELGVIRVFSGEELVETAFLLLDDERKRIPCGRGVGIVTFGGGNGVLAVDQCAQSGLTTPALSEECVERLKPLLVSVATAANPLDLTPSTAFRAESLALLPQALDVLAAEPSIDSIIIIVGSLAVKANEISGVIREFWKRSPKPVCVAWPAPPSGVRERLAEHGIYAFTEPARGIRALSRLAASGEAVAAPARRRPPEPFDFDWSRFVPSGNGRVVLPEDRCHAILEAAGLSAAARRLVATESEAAEAAAHLGYPVVLKGISPAITHRAEAGLLAVNLASEEEVIESFRMLLERARSLRAELDGILVQAMAKGGTELLVSSFKDPLFGTMITCGSGGGMTELIKDVVTRRAPVDEADAAAMIDRLRIRENAKDNDGHYPTDAAARFVSRFSRLAVSAPWETFVFEVNPIKWSRSSAVAVDGLIILER
jgi:acyl-CoA synthetase (NDP forming)